MRTHYCGQMNESLIAQPVTLCGWVHRRRDHGGLIFIDLRDRTGVIQVVASPDYEEQSFKKAIYMALDIYKNRKMHTELTENPLAFGTFKKER